MQFDVLIVGGGPAGLSAALILGRCHRTVSLCDEGHQRNLSSHAIHGFLGREGYSPASFRDDARADLSRYKFVSVRGTQAMAIDRSGEGFNFCLCGLHSWQRLQSPSCHGLGRRAPRNRGYPTALWHHCLYCDGFEYAGKPVAAYGRGDKGAELAVMMKQWIADVVACSDGTQVSAQAMRKLAEHNIQLRTESIRHIEGTNGELTKIVFEGRPDLPRAGLFFSTGCHQASDLSERLGCKRNMKGGVVIDPDTEESSVSGVYVAGDVSRDVVLVAVAIAEGAQAAVAINKAFLRRDGFCD